MSLGIFKVESPGKQRDWITQGGKTDFTVQMGCSRLDLNPKSCTPVKITVYDL